MNLPPWLDLHGQVAVVTGAGSPHGIGFAAAAFLGQLGAAVVLAATSDRVHERASALALSGASADGVVGDLTNEADADRLVAETVRLHGRLDILVNNAGMVSVTEPAQCADVAQELSLAGWRASLRRNLDTAFLVSRSALPVMKQNRGGRIVMVASVTGPIMAMRGDVAYSAAKAGMVGLTRAMAVDVADCGITVNAVAPGWIATGSQTEAERQQGLSTPLRRSGTPEEVASAIAWLASPGAAYVTGQCVVVDGANSVAESRGTA